MTGHAGIEMNETARFEESAVQAWKSLRSSTVLPKSIESLKPPHRHSSVFRLAGAGADGSNVIAKRSHISSVSLERTIYQQVLCRVPVCTPQFYGFVPDEDPDCGWLFFEDVGDEPYSPKIPEHRTFAGLWLGSLHRAAATIPAAAQLPDRGAKHHLEKIPAVRETLSQGLANPVLRAEDTKVLGAMSSQCDTLESHWEEISAVCERAPKTLVHGDFSYKNVRVRPAETGMTLAAFDWESAGWAAPALDLPWIDVAAYSSALSGSWPSVRLSDIELLANAGKLFRCLAAMPGEGASLRSAWTEHAMRRMRFYHAEISAAIRAFGWGQ